MGINYDFAKPAFANPLDTDLDQIRDNYQYLLAMVASMVEDDGIVVLPGWDTAVDTSTTFDPALPDAYILTRGTRTIWINCTYTGSALNSIQVCYDDGVSSPSMVCLDEATIFYDQGYTDGSDLRIIWAGPPIYASLSDNIPTQARIYFYENSVGIDWPDDATAGYTAGSGDEDYVRTISDLAGPASPSNNVPFAIEEYIVKYVKVGGNATVNLNYTASTSPESDATQRENEWWDLFRADIFIEDNDQDGVAQWAALDITIAVLASGDPSIGQGVPVDGTEVTRRVTLWTNYTA